METGTRGMISGLMREPYGHKTKKDWSYAGKSYAHNTLHKTVSRKKTNVAFVLCVGLGFAGKVLCRSYAGDGFTA